MPPEEVTLRSLDPPHLTTMVTHENPESTFTPSNLQPSCPSSVRPDTKTSFSPSSRHRFSHFADDPVVRVTRLDKADYEKASGETIPNSGRAVPVCISVDGTDRQQYVPTWKDAKNYLGGTHVGMGDPPPALGINQSKTYTLLSKPGRSMGDGGRSFAGRPTMDSAETERRRKVFEQADSVKLTRITPLDYLKAHPGEKLPRGRFVPLRLSATIDGVDTVIYARTWKENAKPYLYPNFIQADDTQPTQDEYEFSKLDPSVRKTRKARRHPNQITEDEATSVEEHGDRDEQREQGTDYGSVNRVQTIDESAPVGTVRDGLWRSYGNNW